jgi:hypothetical protein
MTNTEKILTAADFMQNSHGYVDVTAVSKMTKIEEEICAYVFKQNGFQLTVIPGQYLK